MHDQTNGKISNDELIAALRGALQKEGALVADVMAMLIEVEERRLHLELACSSMFEFCTRRLGMSEGEAYRRITGARLAREFPQVLDAVRSRRVHLSNLVLLRDLINRENVNELLDAAAGKTKRAVQELVARLAPKPDVPTLVRKLPSNPASAPTPLVVSDAATVAASASRPLVGSVVTTMPQAQLMPLSESRHKIQFTASSELRQKLERAQSLMRHRNVDGDLAVVVERALDLLISTLEKEKLGATTRPKPSKSVTVTATTSIPAATRREVVRRDDERCSFVGADGERCTARDFLEIDHRHPRALGGGNEPANLRLLCRAHNQHAAELLFGRDHLARAIQARRRKRSTKTATTRADADAQRPLPMT